MTQPPQLVWYRTDLVAWRCINGGVAWGVDHFVKCTTFHAVMSKTGSNGGRPLFPTDEKCKKGSKKKTSPPATTALSHEGALLAADPQNWFQIISLLAQPPPSPLSVICLQLRDAGLAVLISLAGIIALMIGFAGNTDRRVETSAVSDWELLENRAKTDTSAARALRNLSPHQINFLRAPPP